MGPHVLVNRSVGPDGWNQPPPSSEELRTAWDFINAHTAPETDFHDEIIWILEQSSIFPLKSAYDAISGFTNQNPFPQMKLVWLKGSIVGYFLNPYGFLWHESSQ